MQTTTTKRSPADIAAEIRETCRRLGWTYATRGGILTIHKRITPGSLEEFAAADMEYGSILGRLPRSSAGSDWGTDGGGIGALSAMKTGIFTMNRSGGNKRVLSALA
jgi:hypothetical protein